MEKIYMEKNNNSKKKSVVNFSVVLSFMVSIWAVFSLAMFGIVTNQGTGVSYAWPTPTDTIGDIQIQFQIGDYSLSAKSTDGGNTNTFTVPTYFANGEETKPLFCIEYGSPVVNTAGIDDTYYQREKEYITDAGLLYILNQSAASGKKILGTEVPDFVENYAAQTAIWLYLYRNEEKANGSVAEASLNYITPANLNTIANATQYEKSTTTTVQATYSDSTKAVYTAIDKLVKEALEYSTKKQLTVSKASDNISKTSDEKFYQSDAITVVGNPADDLESYDVSVTGIEGAFIVDEEGNKIETLTGFAPAKKFYVRIPADLVTETVQKVQINVSGHFKSLTGSQYGAHKGHEALVATDDDGKTYQKVVTVNATTTTVPDSIEVEFVGSPNTGMNTAQTIYFIGLIILLCGVGIVYANAKPVQAKQQ